MIDKLTPLQLAIAGIVLLLLSTQLVVMVLQKLENHRFGSVFLGTLITPLCTGFPNLMIGIFGQERLEGDLVLQLNLGNNIANTSLVTGLILFIAGPLYAAPAKGKSKKARKAFVDQYLALFFLWLGFAAIWVTARDGSIGLTDGIGLTALYLLYHLISFRRRGKIPAKKRLGKAAILFIFTVLGAATWLIHLSIGLLERALDHTGSGFQGSYWGLLLGLLTVIPESFLLLRLALRQGNLGLSGLIGDCLVSIPLVVGLSAMLNPIATTRITQLTSPAMWPYLHLFVTMTAFSFLSLKKVAVPRKLGLFFLLLYAIVWWNTTR